MLTRTFLEHPREMGETYGEHFAMAAGFAGELIVAGLACAVHAVAPCLFQRTGSTAVARLHHRMFVSRRAVQ